jgi:mono/diheme cytochrome c family protein
MSWPLDCTGWYTVGRIRSYVVVVAAGVGLALVSATASPAAALDGRALYQRYCESCHGVSGRGNGPDAEIFATPPRDLHSGFLARYPMDDLVRRVQSGVPLELALDLPALRERAGDIEALAAYLERVPTVNWRRVAEGQAVYVDRCELCHGRAGNPGPTVPRGVRPPRDLGDSAFQRSVTDVELKTVVGHGRRGMPAIVPPVDASELPALIAFVRLLSPGYALYDRYCAACHGDDGHGAGSFGEEARRPTVIFDRAYFQRRDPEQVRTALWHMLATERPAMPHFRKKLSEVEARAVVVYLKQAE